MTQPPRVMLSDLSGRAYVVTRYTEKPDGSLIAHAKTDVTDDVVHDLMARAWARGWKCGAESMAESVRWGETNCERPDNPYRADRSER